MDKKQLKAQNSITIRQFLTDYCDITNENWLEFLENLSHSDLKKECGINLDLHLKSVPFEVVKQGDINVGDIILVRDGYSNTAPYKNPQRQKEHQDEYERIAEKYERIVEEEDNWLSRYDDLIEDYGKHKNR